MGGTCWKTFEEECIEKGQKEGLEKGIEKGLAEGQLQTLASLVKDGIITEELAASRANMSLEEYRKAVTELL